jgi:hypothetical protein
MGGNMWGTFRRQGLMAALLGCLLVAVAAAAAGGKARTTCDARAGSTVIEDGVARVYSAGGELWACRRGTGPSHRLFPDAAGPPESLGNVELAGPFVAYEVKEPVGVDSALERLDLSSAGAPDVRELDEQLGSTVEDYGYRIDGFGVNAAGTVVWLDDESNCYTVPCQTISYLIEDRGGHVSRLATATSNSRIAPIAELGLSESGFEAYWTDTKDGKPARADIGPPPVCGIALGVGCS